MATAITQNQGVITRMEFHGTPEFLALTDKQRVWIDLFLDSQDANRATREAYGTTTNDAYTVMLTRKIETSPRIIAALNIFYGRTEREAFLLNLERTIARESGPARVSAMQLYARLKFNGESETPGEPTSKTEPPVQKFAIGAVIVQDDKKYLVKAEEI